jgi:dienelactone hydrolase
MKRIAIFLFAVLALCRPALAQIARTEIHPLPSVTLTVNQILRGDLNGKPVTLAGELRLPRTGTDRLPVVILVHGSGGVGPNVDAWAREINALGAAAFILDSFSGRGITSTVSDQTQLEHLAMMTDLFRAKALLARHPRIDPARIAVMGFSKGAVAAVYSSSARFQKLYDPDGARFAAHIGLYTPCYMRLRDEEKTTGAPIRLFHGAPDDWVPVAPCRDYVAQLKRAGADIALTEYPGAWHGYDSPATSPPIVIAQAQTSRACRMQESADGQLLNTATGQEFSYADACVQHGAHIGYNPEAYAATLTAVRAFLKWALQL